MNELVLAGIALGVGVQMLDLRPHAHPRTAKGQSTPARVTSTKAREVVIARADLAAVAREHGLTIEACAEAEDYSSVGVGATKCVDDRLLTSLFGGSWVAGKDPGQRPACRCVPSRDIGAVDTCTFGCAYCYATRSEDAARRRRAEHDPGASALWPGPRA